MAKGKGSSTSSGGSNNAKDMKMFLKNRMWRDHWQILTAVGLIVVAMFASAFVQFSYSDQHIYQIRTSDTILMHKVFKSGEPWTVLCSKPDDILPKLFDKASKKLVGKSFIGVLDCSEILGSGKSVYERFNIRRDITPTIFTVANGEKPKQVLDFILI